MSTVPLPITLTAVPSTSTNTTLIPLFWIALACSFEIFSSFSTNTSPVSGWTIVSQDIWPAILEAKLNFLLYLYLPTFDKS